ncbi:MAG TPA: hypothetical protein V6C91_21870 [Coleofasciculaceae cyanobacterium]
MKKPFSPRSTRSGSEGLRIAQEIAAIQAALHKHGLRTRKQPKQAAWKIFTPHPDAPSLPREETDKHYLLTYQPAPISAWVIHPQTNEPQRHTIETIIQRALAPATRKPY